MTEIQDRKKGGPLLFDLDFRYLAGTKERKFNDQHIDDVAEIISIAINKVCETEKIEPFPLFVFTKKNINDIDTNQNSNIVSISALKRINIEDLVVKLSYMTDQIG